MSKEEWEQFIGTKKRTARTHYSLGRQCARCSRYITDNNKTSFCHICKSLIDTGESRSEGWSGESQKHLDLKRKAIEYLEKLGCYDIKTETHSKTTKRIFDVTGKLKAQDKTTYMVVECGGSSARKLTQISNENLTLFIWPYHEDNPYLYQTGMEVCSMCGHQK